MSGSQPITYTAFAIPLFIHENISMFFVVVGAVVGVADAVAAVGFSFVDFHARLGRIWFEQK